MTINETALFSPCDLILWDVQFGGFLASIVVADVEGVSCVPANDVLVAFRYVYHGMTEGLAECDRIPVCEFPEHPTYQPHVSEVEDLCSLAGGGDHAFDRQPQHLCRFDGDNVEGAPLGGGESGPYCAVSIHEVVVDGSGDLTSEVLVRPFVQTEP